MTQQRLETIFGGFRGKRIAVIGDLMLDRYVWGSVGRISPEAPVPVVEVEEESTRLGGAANVANNIASLGGIPVMVGVVGDDDGGNQLRSIVEQLSFPTSGVITDPSRPTTVKTRVIAHHQHVVRIDHEVRHDISAEVRSKLLKILEDHLNDLDGIILEDYNKGVLTSEVIRNVIALGGSRKKAITVDPKFDNFFDFQGVTVFKPNRKETEEALGRKIHSLEDAQEAGKLLLTKLNAENVLLTLGEQGMLLFERSGASTHVPTMARKVADVSGAGDTVVSTLTVGLAAGASVKEAATLANFAGGIVCGEVGIVPVAFSALFETVLQQSNHAPAERSHG